MSLGTKIAWDDTVLPFQLDRSDIRGRVARLDGVLDNVLAQHDYPPAIEALVAEATLLTALIGQTIKLRWKLSLQVRGNGPARLIATGSRSCSASPPACSASANARCTERSKSTACGTDTETNRPNRESGAARVPSTEVGATVSIAAGPSKDGPPFVYVGGLIK